jgi:anti-sigma regulatory factor (Ser/Thr protein kinase)
VSFNLQWQPLEEVVGSALRASASQLRQHVLRTVLPADLPLLRFDAVLIERVLCNLLENAAKYTPAGAQIELSAEVHGTWLQLTVADDGPACRPGARKPSSKNLPVASANRPSRASGWGWRSAVLLWKPMAAASQPRLHRWGRGIRADPAAGQPARHAGTGRTDRTR